jgi:hypothetical protein
MAEGNNGVVHIATRNAHGPGDLPSIGQHLRRGKHERPRPAGAAGGELDEANRRAGEAPGPGRKDDKPGSVPAEAGAEFHGERMLRGVGFRGVERHGHGAGMHQSQKHLEPRRSVRRREDDGASAQSLRRSAVEVEPRARARVQLPKGDHPP